jgi:hypothetical protein
MIAQISWRRHLAGGFFRLRHQATRRQDAGATNSVRDFAAARMPT